MTAQALRSLCFSVLILCNRMLAESQTSLVRVYVTDASGIAIPNARLKVTDHRAQAYTPMPGGTYRVPYGIYSIVAFSAGFAEVKRQVRVYQPDVWVNVALPLGGFGDREYRVVKGTVLPAPRDSHSWVRLLPVLGTYIAEGQLDPLGRFSISELDTGEHILLVIAGGTVIHSQRVMIKGTGATVTVRLE